MQITFVGTCLKSFASGLPQINSFSELPMHDLNISRANAVAVSCSCDSMGSSCVENNASHSPELSFYRIGVLVGSTSQADKVSKYGDSLVRPP